MRHAEIRVARRGGRRPRRVSGSRRPPPRLAIVVHGGVVQGVYAGRCGPLTVYLLDYDDLRGDDALAEQVRRTGEFPQVTVEAGLARALAEYRAVAAGQARLRRTAETGR
ncbi:MAG: hypothetical protein ACREJR_08400 [Candidatus Rokuibacteriota bacterium]